MRRYLSAVAAVGLVAGAATTASAVDFSGRGAGYYLNYGAVSTDQAAQHAFSMHHFTILPALRLPERLARRADGRSADDNSWGDFYANGWYKAAGALNIGVLYFYAAGNDHAVFDSGSYEGEPGNGGFLPGDSNDADLAVQTAGMHAVAVAADYQVSAQLELHGAVAYAVTDKDLTGLAGNAYENDYGWEFDVGAAYRLLDNLTYQAHFGYTVVGDFFKKGEAEAQPGNLYLLSHHLTMTF